MSSQYGELRPTSGPWTRAPFLDTREHGPSRSTGAVVNCVIIGSRSSDHYFRSVCWFLCLCRIFLSRLWSDFDQTRTYVVCLSGSSCVPCCTCVGLPVILCYWQHVLCRFVRGLSTFIKAYLIDTCRYTALPPSVQRQGCRTPKIEIFTQIWPKCGI